MILLNIKIQTNLVFLKLYKFKGHFTKQTSIFETHIIHNYRTCSSTTVFLFRLFHYINYPDFVQRGRIIVLSNNLNNSSKGQVYQCLHRHTFLQPASFQF